MLLLYDGMLANNISHTGEAEQALSDLVSYNGCRTSLLQSQPTT